MGSEKNDISFWRRGNIEIVNGKSIHSFPKHSHSSFCIGVITDGKIGLKINEQQYLLEKDDIYLVPPFTEHTIECVNETYYGYLVMCLNSDFVERYNNALLHQFVYKDEKSRSRILELHKKIYNTDSYHQVENEIEHFLEEIIMVDRFSTKDAQNKIVLAATAYIREHIMEPFSLEKISVYTHTSKYHLLRLFKRQMGAAPYQFYVQEKVKKIRQGLIKDQTPADLSFDLNFADQSHLCNTFRKYIGLTPGQFKRSYKLENIRLKKV